MSSGCGGYKCGAGRGRSLRKGDNPTIIILAVYVKNAARSGLLRHFCRRITISLSATIELWWFPVLAGTAIAVIVWVVWYLTEVPCTPANAIDYQCNPSAIARYIDSEILTRCITLGGLVATLGGEV